MHFEFVRHAAVVALIAGILSGTAFAQGNDGASKAASETSADFSAPRPFSYFTGESWVKELKRFGDEVTRIQWVVLTNRGTAGIDGVRFKRDNNVQIDGVFYQKFEVWDLRNLRHNNVTVTAPGLLNLAEDTLQIDAEPKLDTVALDGCLTWKNIKHDETYTYWDAVDAENATRHVKIALDVPTKVAEKCDNRYLQEQLKKAPPPKPQKPGEGFSFNMADLRRDDTEIYIIKRADNSGAPKPPAASPSDPGSAPAPHP